MKFGMLQAGP